MLKVVLFGSLIGNIAMFFTLPSKTMYAIIPNVAFLGFFLLPILPLGYSFGSEITYPTSEAMSNGIMCMFS